MEAAVSNVKVVNPSAGEPGSFWQKKPESSAKPKKLADFNLSPRATRTPGGVERAKEVLSKLDPDKPVELEQRHFEAGEFQREVAAGNLIPVTTPGARKIGPEHTGIVGGIPQTNEMHRERVRDYDTLQHIHDTGQLPKGGKVTPKGTICIHGFAKNPKFGVPAFLDHPSKIKHGDPASKYKLREA